MRKHNCPVNRFIYLLSPFREKTKNVRAKRGKINVGRQKKTIHPLCTPSFASSSHSNSLRDDDDEKKTEIIKKHSQKKEKKTDAKNEKKER